MWGWPWPGCAESVPESAPGVGLMGQAGPRGVGTLCPCQALALGPGQLGAGALVSPSQ